MILSDKSIGCLAPLSAKPCEQCVCAYANVSARVDSARVIVCVLSALEASSAIWPQSTGATWWESKCHWSGQPMPSPDSDVRAGQRCPCPKIHSQTRRRVPSLPDPSPGVFNDGEGELGIKPYPSMALDGRAEC